MNKLSPFLLGLSLAVAGNTMAAAQDNSATTVSAPKYLQVTVEYTKPGKGGMAHDKTESAFVQAMVKAKYPIHYVAFNSMSGKARAIYLAHFDSFDSLQKANKIFDDPATAKEFERLNVADGELLDESKQLIFSYAKPDGVGDKEYIVFHMLYLSSQNSFNQLGLTATQNGFTPSYGNDPKTKHSEFRRTLTRERWVRLRWW